MWQKGPGAGYGAARAEVLLRFPKAVCRRETRGTGQISITGYFVYLDGNDRRERADGAGRSAREAWNKALERIDRLASGEGTQSRTQGGGLVARRRSPK